MADAKRYEMIWDCAGCDSKGLLGLTHRHCPNCGAAQDPTRRYFPPAGQEVAVEDHPFQGVDKLCPGCDTPNAAKAEFCVNCGSPLDKAKAVALRAAQAAAVGGTFAEDTAKAAAEEAAKKKAAERAAAQGQPPAPPPEPPKKRGLMWFAGLGCASLALLACIGFLVTLLWSKESGVTVIGHTWQRDIAIGRYQTVHESAWDNEVPAGARGQTCVQKERSTEKVADGQECHDVRHDNGDGTFSTSQDCTTKYRDEPVYDDWCSYDIDKWDHVRNETTQGSSVADTPRWAEITLANTGALGSERESGRTETYGLHFRDEDQRELACNLAQDRWAGVADGSTWKASVGVLADTIDCDSLKPL